MISKNNTLEILNGLMLDKAAAAPPKPEIIALNRITYGATQAQIDQVKSGGMLSFIQQQLHPDNSENEQLTSKLASLTLQIKYAEKDGIPAVDEMRPLSFINAPIEQLWKLNSKDQMVNYQEKVRPLEEVRAASWLKAVYSKWQLREVMTEFWHNHFNVNASDQKIATVFPIYDRDVIRKNCFGNFRQFLEDVAKSTAMLYYLDNFTSKASPANENYARELFELHTLGSDYYYNNLYNKWRNVPGALEGKPIGYIDEDVYEAARAFTGWTVADGQKLGNDNFPDTGEFYYYDGWHDNYQKRILGNEISPNQPARSDGNKALDLVAYHPATANHISKKLCIRFISDSPSKEIITSTAKVWVQNQKSADQIGQTLNHIFRSKEFSATWGKKVKRPFHLMASILRQSGADFTPTTGMTGQLSQMGYHHYNWLTPTGHPDNMEYWLSSNSMLARWNQASGILSVNPNNKIAAYDFASAMPAGMTKSADIVSFWIERFLQKPMSTDVITSMTNFLSNGKPDEQIPLDKMNNRLGPMIALITMSPDFQLI